MKGQVVLNYLMAYGWVILIVVIVIAVAVALSNPDDERKKICQSVCENENMLFYTYQVSENKCICAYENNTNTFRSFIYGN